MNAAERPAAKAMNALPPLPTLHDGRPLPPALDGAECLRFGGRAGLMMAYAATPAAAASVAAWSTAR